MAFKFAILLLSSVIINNSVSQPSTREVLSKAFGIAYDCYKYDVPGSDDPTILDKSDFLDFVGEFSYNSVSLEAPDYISFDDFSELVPLICKKQDIDINDFLKERIAAADLMTNAFDLAHGSNTLGSIRNMMSIRQTAFLDFVGKEDNLEHVNSYWTANSVSKEAQDNIRLIEFRKLVYWICSKREFVLKDFLEERIPVAETIVSSFNIAVAYYKNFCAENITISQSYPASERRYIRQSDILDFLGEEKGNVFLRRLKEYRTVNPVSEKQRDKISFEEFRGIMKLICSKQQFDLKDFLDKRREAVVVIKKAFDLAYELYTKTGKNVISLSDFLFFVGKDKDNCFKVANSVLKGKDELYMKDFKNTLYLIFSNQELVLKDFLEKKMAVIKVVKNAWTTVCNILHVGDKHHLRQSELLDFMGRADDSHLHFLKDYWSLNIESLNEQDNMGFKRFADLVIFICAKKNIDIKDFLRKRIAVAEDIHTAYTSALKHYKIALGKGFSESKFLEFVGKKENLQLVNQFWTVKGISIKRQDNIDQKMFSRLVQYICSERSYDIAKFLNERLANMSSKS